MSVILVVSAYFLVVVVVVVDDKDMARQMIYVTEVGVQKKEE